MEELKYFFSYSRTDSEFVLKLAKELRAAGANVWLDQLDILGGQHWDRTIEETLKSCKGMIAVLSPESVASENVMDEVSYALNKGKLVVPVMLRPCSIPLRLERVQYIDFTVDYEAGFSQLVRALGIGEAGQPTESAARETVDEKPPLPEKSEPITGEQKPAKEYSKNLMVKILAAMGIVVLIVVVSIAVFLCLQPKTHSLTTIAVNANGEVRKIPDKAFYNHDETVTLKAVPNDGYSFANWSGDWSEEWSDNNDSIELIMNADKTVTATFALKTYSLDTPVLGAEGSVNKDPYKNIYNHGDTVTLKAVPSEGYNFTNWKGDWSDSNNPTTLVMDANKSVTANFALKTYSLDTPVLGAEGSVNKDPDKDIYHHGEMVTLKAVPNEGCNFTKWSGDLSGVENPAKLVMDAHKSVTATFALNTYSLTTAEVNGVVAKIPDKDIYNHGETVTLEAVPNEGCNFTKWSGDLSGVDNPATLVMDAHKSVTATFALKTYSLTTDEVNGVVAKIPDKDIYNHGETVTLEAVPNEGCNFTKWSGDLSGVDNPATLVMDSNKSVTAGFVLKVVTNSIDMKLVYIPAGSFMMGSPSDEEGRKKDEEPQHQVDISKGFRIGQTEVTQGQYKLVMNAQPWSTEKVQKDPNCPAGFVSWDDAVEFCRKLSILEDKTYRLPTEAEWEYACRAGATTRFGFGDSDLSLDTYAWFRENANNSPRMVMHKEPNRWGLYDMHGNVTEWCSDRYASDYYSKSPRVDPIGPLSDTEERCCRGGSFYSEKNELRCSFRTRQFRGGKYRGLGFRVVCSE